MECLTSDPMKNDLILEKIFWFCDVSSLKRCRLVSRNWRDLSLKAWRDKATIQLDPVLGCKIEFGEFLHYLDFEEHNDSFQLKKYPFKRYFIDLDEWHTDGWRYWEQKRVAIAIFNSRAHHVKIDWDPNFFTGFNEFLSILNSDSLKVLEVIWHTLLHEIPETVQPLANCSNLKRLKLYTRYLAVDHSPQLSLWGFLLKSFPNLEALSVGYELDKEKSNKHVNYPICLADRLEIANLLKSLRQSGVMSLKEFEMMDVYPNQNVYESEPKEYDIIKTLAECKFPLERLSIHVGWHGGDGDQIPLLPVLRSCKDTLQYLKASINFNSAFFSKAYYNEYEDGTGKIISELKPSASKDENVSMDALKELRLVNGLEWALYLLAHLDIPQLEKLVVECEKNRNPYQDDRNGIVKVSFPPKMYERMHTFELHDNPHIPPRKMIRMFAKMMPNLTHLKIPLDKRSFPLVCEKLKGLKKLHILEGKSDYVEIDDEGLTGISKSQLEKERRPNITDLEQLSDFRICCQGQLRRDEVKFTEHSVIFGFLQLPRLYNFSIAIKELSDEVKEKLLSHVKGKVHFQSKLVKLPRDTFQTQIVSGDNDNSSDSNDSGEDEVSSDSE